jgi:Uma2 family endonuclease
MRPGPSLSDMDAAPIPTKRWARVEYERLIDLAVLRSGDRVELVGGQLVVREPQGSPHAVAVGLTENALRAAFGTGWVVQVQMPVALDDESEPEPDAAVCAGRPRDYLTGHPTRPALLVEVADSSGTFDREHKGSLYARAQL